MIRSAMMSSSLMDLGNRCQVGSTLHIMGLDGGLVLVASIIILYHRLGGPVPLKRFSPVIICCFVDV